MSQSPILAFTSLAFEIEPGEDEATNPGIFGKALAHWLGDALRSRDVPAGDVFPEDFGWCLRIGTKSDKLFVACTSDPAHRGRWQVFVLQDRGLLAGIFGGGGTPESVNALFATVREILEGAPEVQNLHDA